MGYSEDIATFFEQEISATSQVTEMYVKYGSRPSRVCNKCILLSFILIHVPCIFYYFVL